MTSHLLKFQQKQKVSQGLFLVFLFFVLWDVGHIMAPEIIRMTPAFNEVMEIVILITGASAFVAVWELSRKEERNQVSHQAELKALQHERDAWKDKNAKVIEDFRRYIHQHFERWGLTQTETEIGFYLLQGLSFSAIAAARGVSERTIRNQSLAIYSKAGLSGKHELAAYFLEELLMNTRTPPA